MFRGTLSVVRFMFMLIYNCEYPATLIFVEPMCHTLLIVCRPIVCLPFLLVLYSHVIRLAGINRRHVF